MEDHIDLLREQHKILSGDVALYSSALKRFYGEAAQNPEKEQINLEIQRLNGEIKSKSQQIASLEKQISAAILASCKNINSSELSQPFSELMGKLNEKSFELEGFTFILNVLEYFFQCLAEVVRSVDDGLAGRLFALVPAWTDRLVE